MKYLMISFKDYLSPYLIDFCNKNFKHKDTLFCGMVLCGKSCIVGIS